MPQIDAFGFIARREDYYANTTVVSGVGQDYSTSMTYSPVPPALNAVRRKRPPEKDLVWNGTAYAKTRHVYRYSQLQYRKANVAFPFYRIWTSSRSLIGVPQPVYPSEPYDPMNPLLGKINGDLANLANSLGEYKQTAKMFSDAVKRFRRSVGYARRAVKLAKRGRPRDALYSVRNAVASLGSAAAGAARAAFPPNRAGRSSLSNAWLQWHFGVDTLMKDIHSVCEELQNEVDILPPSTVKRYSKRSRRDLEAATMPYLGNATRTRWLTVSSRFTRTLIAYVEIDNRYLKLASDHGLTNPAGLIWELATLSFVVDWLIGIGEWLTALNVPTVIGRSICYETVRKQAIQQVWFDSNDFAKTGTFLETTCTVSSRHKETSRSIRTLAASRPRWKPKASATRVATALALLRQMSQR